MTGIDSVWAEGDASYSATYRATPRPGRYRAGRRQGGSGSMRTPSPNHRANLMAISSGAAACRPASVDRGGQVAEL